MTLSFASSHLGSLCPVDVCPFGHIKVLCVLIPRQTCLLLFSSGVADRFFFFFLFLKLATRMRRLKRLKTIATRAPGDIAIPPRAFPNRQEKREQWEGTERRTYVRRSPPPPPPPSPLPPSPSAAVAAFRDVYSAERRFKKK